MASSSLVKLFRQHLLRRPFRFHRGAGLGRRLIKAAGFRHQRHRQGNIKKGPGMPFGYFIIFLPFDATVSEEFYAAGSQHQRDAGFFLPRVLFRQGRQGHLGSQRVPGPGPDLSHPRQDAGAEGIRIRYAGDQKLAFLHGRTRQHAGHAVQGPDLQHQSRPPGHHVGRGLFVHDLRRRHPLPHLHLRPAAGDIHRDPAQFRDVQQDMVADVLPIQGQSECAQPYSVFLQRP